MSPESLWLATCLLGVAVTAVAVRLGRREHLTTRVRILIWVGPALVLLGGVQTLDAADLSERGRGLWLSGAVVLVAAAVVALAADRPALRTTAAVVALGFAALFVLGLAGVDPLGALLPG